MLAAYDYFPCQFQLWYRTRGKTMWYDPIFKVKTLDGRETWRRRHYKVQRADTPGSFYFSVLDNGVTSKWVLLYFQCSVLAHGTAQGTFSLGFCSLWYLTEPHNCLGRSAHRPCCPWPFQAVSLLFFCSYICHMHLPTTIHHTNPFILGMESLLCSR
jgi:hypothetical protein